MPRRRPEAAARQGCYPISQPALYAPWIYSIDVYLDAKWFKFKAIADWGPYSAPGSNMARRPSISRRFACSNPFRSNAHRLRPLGAPAVGARGDRKNLRALRRRLLAQARQ